MQTKATVTAVDGRFATVETQRSSACEGCHKAESPDGCSVCSLMGGQRKLSARAMNTAGAKVGDVVLIESNTGRMLWYSVLVFVLPVLLALLGYGIANGFHAGTAWQIGCGAIGFFGTFFGIFIYSEVVRKNKCDVEITEIVTEGEPENGSE